MSDDGSATSRAAYMLFDGGPYDCIICGDELCKICECCTCCCCIHSKEGDES